MWWIILLTCYAVLQLFIVISKATSLTSIYPYSHWYSVIIENIIVARDLYPDKIVLAVIFDIFSFPASIIIILLELIFGWLLKE